MRDGFDRVTRLLQDGIDDRVFPAAVAEVGSSSAAVWRAARGRLTFGSDAPPATVDTIFDLASLTKPLATTSLVADLLDRRELRLEDSPSRFCPEWTGADRAGVTIRHLLEHSSGLSARLVDRPPRGRRAFEHEICSMPLEYQPASRSIYSDLGFILLGFCAETACGEPLGDRVQALLDEALARNAESSERAELLVEIPPESRVRTAPTRPLCEDERRGSQLVGAVHDNYAAALGGFAGHAGLFGTVPGVARLARTILRAARGDRTIASPFTAARITQFIDRTTVNGSSRALGWDTMLPTSSCGTHLSPAAFGHVGFTGTSLWIDPPRDRYFVLLTNRVCDGGTIDQMRDFRRAFHDLAATT